MNNVNNKQRGLSILGILFLGLIIILVLGYFHISIRSAVNNPDTQDNLNYVGGGTVSLWDKYLEQPASYVWNNIVVNIFWKSFISNMERIRDGQPTDIQNAAPKVNPS